ncbi:MAG: SRPBCC family protein [Burkholderiaceae bacterium]|nr:SRPBCC family protein [Burkholderiaceae bacterium]
MSTELILERVVPLTPEELWRGWTEPELLKTWFCPRPWQTTLAEIDLRPGGLFRTVMEGPDGERFDGSGCWLVVEPPHRLVWTSALGPGFAPLAPGAPFVFSCELRFDPVEGGTRYTARAVHATAEAAQQHAAMGFHDGWGKALDQLVEVVTAARQSLRGHVAEG